MHPTAELPLSFVSNLLDTNVASSPSEMILIQGAISEAQVLLLQLDSERKEASHTFKEKWEALKEKLTFVTFIHFMTE